jgi:hypothetical protein
VTTANPERRARQWHRGNLEDHQQDPIDQFVTDASDGCQFLTSPLMILSPGLPGIVSRPPCSQSQQRCRTSRISPRLLQRLLQDLEGQVDQFLGSIK